MFSLISLTLFGQKNKEKVNEVLTSFQTNLAEGLDLSPFDTIPDIKIRKIKIDAYINLCRAKGMIAQRNATTTIDSKSKEQSLSDDELLIIIYNAYKDQIPELKKSYLDYLKSEEETKKKNTIIL